MVIEGSKPGVDLWTVVLDAQTYAWDNIGHTNGGNKTQGICTQPVNQVDVNVLVVKSSYLFAKG